MLPPPNDPAPPAGLAA